MQHVLPRRTQLEKVSAVQLGQSKTPSMDACQIKAVNRLSANYVELTLSTATSARMGTCPSLVPASTHVRKVTLERAEKVVKNAIQAVRYAKAGLKCAAAAETICTMAYSLISRLISAP